MIRIGNKQIFQKGDTFLQGFHSKNSIKVALGSYLAWAIKMNKRDMVKALKTARLVKLKTPNTSYPTNEYLHRNNPKKPLKVELDKKMGIHYNNLAREDANNYAYVLTQGFVW